jgi:SAM-dependent methyltransferase
MDELTRKRANAFGPVAEIYARVRPGYPGEALSWLLPKDAGRVVDVGAGTGALSGSLLALGLEVIAVEPDPEMRRVLAGRHPSADVRAGSAEEIPVGEGEVDAVVGAQMWHWVEPATATSEVARVLRPGGTLGLLWNLRDERVAWMAALGAVVPGEDVWGPSGLAVTLPDNAPFDGGAVRQFPWSQELAPTALVDLMATRSRVQVLDAEAREAVLAKVGELARTHPDLRGRDVVEVPYVTTCFRAVRRSGGTEGTGTADVAPLTAP